MIENSARSLKHPFSGLLGIPQDNTLSPFGFSAVSRWRFLYCFSILSHVFGAKNGERQQMQNSTKALKAQGESIVAKHSKRPCLT